MTYNHGESGHRIPSHDDARGDCRPLDRRAGCHPSADWPWELVRGELITHMPVQPEHGDCVQAISTAVELHLGGRSQALMGPEIGFIVARHPDTVRAPDWSLTWRDDAEARRRGAWI